MEPMDCVIQLGQDGCEVWAGSQLQTVDQGVIAATVGLPPQQVKIHTMLGHRDEAQRILKETEALIEKTRGNIFRPFLHERRAAYAEAFGDTWNASDEIRQMYRCYKGFGATARLRELASQYPHYIE